MGLTDAGFMGVGTLGSMKLAACNFCINRIHTRIVQGSGLNASYSVVTRFSI